MKIGIIGLGYVGLPLAVAFAEAGHTVQGVDVDPSKVAALNGGDRTSRTSLAGAAVARRRVQGLDAVCRPRNADAVLICVPTR